MKNKLGLMYKVYLGRLKQHTNTDKVISKIDASFILTNIFRVPKNIRYSVLKEMELNGLISFISRRDLIIN